LDTHNTYAGLDVEEKGEGNTPLITNNVITNGLNIGIGAFNIGRGMINKSKEIGDYVD
jgi:hypothetical protein